MEPRVSYTHADVALGASADRHMSPSAIASGRILMVDLLRLLATVQMVQGHTIDAVLDPLHRSGPVHDGWTVARGLTSVAFLFVAGLSFHIATLQRFERHRGDPTAIAQRFRRAGTLVLIGYVLHFPAAWLLSSDPVVRSAALHEAAIVDILQCIGLVLAVLEVLVLWLPSRRAVELACGGVGAGILALSPLGATLDPSGALRPVLNYVTPTGGSIFPLLPWAAHMFLGVALAPLLLGGRQWARCAGTGAALLAAAWAAGGTEPVSSEHLGRLGWVLVGCGGLALLAPAARSWPPWLLGLAGETLFIYVLHIVLAYGQGIGLSDRVGPVLGVGQSVLLAAAMIVLSCGGALIYRRLASGLAARTATS